MCLPLGGARGRSPELASAADPATCRAVRPGCTGSSATAFPDSTRRIGDCRSANSNRTSGSNPARRQICSAQCLEAVPRGSITQAAKTIQSS